MCVCVLWHTMMQIHIMNDLTYTLKSSYLSCIRLFRFFLPSGSILSPKLYKLTFRFFSLLSCWFSHLHFTSHFNVQFSFSFACSLLPLFYLFVYHCQNHLIALTLSLSPRFILFLFFERVLSHLCDALVAGILKFFIHDQEFYNLYVFVFVSMIWIPNSDFFKDKRTCKENAFMTDTQRKWREKKTQEMSEIEQRRTIMLFWISILCALLILQSWNVISWISSDSG